ncbi:FAD-dependent oxidoreductase [Aquincola sp. S2]|uniref:FAD-dependent oxidoreductase n=1 Tax=Pseudaquabacterium terrae TaxID=2732868 RepID=A0ABX2ECC7_9BURK|nr:FAD-dependent oxidoreductase [Aquabacterium terrae]NRF66271.1 FAD-dependent oxidoreductase [Aquabacterium terrae]
MTHATPRGRTVCIVGAGIVGAATAYALAREGWQVTLVDARPAPGLGESRANGAQLSYSYVEPLATPAALRALPGWLLSDDSPLRWRPRPEAAHLRWLAAFVAACRWSEVRRTTAALLALSGLSRTTLQRWLAEQPGIAGAALHRQPGKLVLYRDAAARAAVERQLAWQRALGCTQRVVNADECRALEPALGASAAAGGGPIAFGVWTADEEVIDASLLAQALVDASGATRCFGSPALGFELRGGRVVALRLAGRTLEADQFVLAAGPACAELLQPLGWAPAIEPIRGYSITLPVVDAAVAPRASVTDQGRKLVYARLGEQLRVAGFAELCGLDRRIDPRRIAALCDAVRETFPGACRFVDPQPWAGLRPATPGGRPLVGATRWPGLWLNAGHGALGLTLAGGSAALITDLMSGRHAAIETRPFSVEPA